MKQTGPFLDHLAALTEPVRCRILLILERHELTVGELCSVLQLPQSTVSRHLKTLGEAGWVVSRKDGTSRFYHLVESGDESPLPQLWNIIRGELGESPAAAQDSKRLESTLGARRSKSQAFFASAAGEWDRLRGELFGTRFYAQSLLALLDPGWVVGDLGCGTGQVSALVAPFVKQVVAVDASSEMLSAARSRLRKHKNVEIRKGVLEELPIEDDSLDVAAFTLVLHHLPDPVAALTEARRVLRPGGRLLIVDMYPHEREEYKQQMGHVWLGFSEDKMSKLVAAAGFEAGVFHSLPPEADAKGPALFTTVAYKSARGSRRQTRLQKVAELAEETA
ncbi:MAG: ArsR/SmtB family transcription factor [Vicinamibacteria bacterium]